jgi:AcrR family transcriptional regulator
MSGGRMTEDDRPVLSRRREAAQEKRGRRYLNRRQEILDAAVRVFRTKGYAAATLADVADELKTDRTTLYYYYRSKEELFSDLVYDVAASNVSALSTIRRSRATPQDKLRDAIVLLMSSYGEHYPYLYLFLDNRLDHEEDEDEAEDSFFGELVALRKQAEDIFTAILAEGMRKGAFDDDVPPRVVAYAVLGMVNWTHRWFEPNGKIGAEQMGEVFARIALRGLDLDPPATPSTGLRP